MSQTLPDQNLSTADIANPQRPSTNTANNDPNPVRDPNYPDISPEPATNTAAANTGNSGDQANPNNREPLFPENELRDFRSRWDQAQGAFVDEPRHAVEQADSLVANVVKRLAEQFADERAKMEKQWDRGDNVSTEDLRQALRRYRSFFDRLLSI
ncbi:MAG TPA: hypothetical protein VLI45_05295 [Acidobacteriaceae bacterium]|nr:hypothetical protein [Acidobacteriaceae bacterium]